MWLLELALTTIIVPLAHLAPCFMNRWFKRVEYGLSRFAAHRTAAVLAVFTLALGVRLAVLRIEPVPVPGIHDEFSYLLMADTFAHGRLTNPPHPMWQHFETFHVNQQPTYCSKFFPAQGLILALGQVVCGHPFWGVWLSTGLMCAAICWALQAWLPPQWAFLGGLLAITKLGIFSYWTGTYWGGSVPALGGALVLGALPRIKRKPRILDATLMAVGLVILANSRPYEGLLYSLPILIALAVYLLRKSNRPTSFLFWRVLTPMGAILLIGLFAMGYYFWRTTGNPLRTPYAVYSAKYDAAPFLPWQTVKFIPIYRHPIMQQFFLGFAMEQYTLTRTAPWLVLRARIADFWLFFIGPALTAPFLLAVGVRPRVALKNCSAKLRLLLLINLVSILSVLPIVYFHPHYSAPLTCALYALLMFCMRRVWVWDRHGSSRGKSVVRAVVTICLIMVAGRALTARIRARDPFLPGFPIQAQLLRAPVLTRLERENGQQLVIVRYAANHSPHEEWVYNDADIDAAKVVWAREMGPAEDQKLISYFKDRHVWLAEPDQRPPKSSLYSTIP